MGASGQQSTQEHPAPSVHSVSRPDGARLAPIWTLLLKEDRMLIELNGATLNPRERHTDIMSHEAHECPRCHRMTFFFTNRTGQTACTECQKEA